MDFIKELERGNSVAIKWDTFLQIYPKWEIRESFETALYKMERQTNMPSIAAESYADTIAKQEKKKSAVELLVRLLVSQAAEKSKVNSDMAAQTVIVKRLFPKIWAQIEDLDLKISPETFDNCKALLLKDLVQKFGSECFLLISMMSYKPADEKMIIDSFKDYLTKQQKPLRRGCWDKFKECLTESRSWILPGVVLGASAFWMLRK